MNVTLPATILTSLVRPYDPAFIRDGILTAVLGAVLILGYGPVSYTHLGCRHESGS